jgi:hypothetical protein
MIWVLPADEALAHHERNEAKSFSAPAIEAARSWLAKSA